MSDHIFMRRAIELSFRMMEAGSGGPFGAVIVRGGEIIAEGWNQVTSANDPTAHAEVTAIRSACERLRTFRLDDCDIYTSCEPCPMCLGAIYWARLNTVYYANTRQQAADIGFDDSFIYDEIPLPLDQRRIPMKRRLPEEALRAFQTWQDKPDKVKY